ncbi:hypothetical protein HDZ31DRAFT_39479, partial [Schizophyllum fasciatum]
ISGSASETASGWSSTVTASASANATFSANATSSATESVNATSSAVVSFPSGSSNSSETSTLWSTTTATTVAVSTTTASFSVNSQYSWITSESLAFAPDSTSTSSTPITTNTDPDAPTSTFDPNTIQPSTTLSVSSLPSSLPRRIYPANGLDSESDTSDKTLISLLFNIGSLNWDFVSTSDVSASQIFAYMPIIIQNSLGITSDKMITFALQVYVTDDYRATGDVQKLGTTFLAYVPQDKVSTLASLIKDTSSSFYKGTGDPTLESLATKVESGFSVLSVSDPNGGSSNGGSSSGSNNDNASSESGASKTREDAIIGVVSALGGVALLVLAFLVYRSVVRRRELAHRRLSEPAEVAGARPADRDFDQDSVGGQRRRSFYYAEDSLRGFEGAHEEPVADMRSAQGPGMTQRRIAPATISAPILRESSMNW